jgi:hypothetical protein
MLRYAIGAAAMVAASALAQPAATQQTRAGLLTCDLSAGLGLIVTSQKQVSCSFAPDRPGVAREDYEPPAAERPMTARSGEGEGGI